MKINLREWEKWVDYIKDDYGDNALAFVFENDNNLLLDYKKRFIQDIISDFLDTYNGLESKISGNFDTTSGENEFIDLMPNTIKNNYMVFALEASKIRSFLSRNTNNCFLVGINEERNLVSLMLRIMNSNKLPIRVSDLDSLREKVMNLESLLYDVRDSKEDFDNSLDTLVAMRLNDLVMAFDSYKINYLIKIKQNIIENLNSLEENFTNIDVSHKKGYFEKLNKKLLDTIPNISRTGSMLVVNTDTMLIEED